MIKRRRRKGVKKGKLSHNWLSKDKKEKILRQFAFNATATTAALTLGISRPCANRWFNHFREKICEHTGVAPRFSGEVEIDVLFFGGMSAKERKWWKQRTEAYGAPIDSFYKRMKAVKDKKASEEGKEPAKKRLKRKVIAIMQRGGRVWCQPIEDQKANTLLPIIYMVVEQDSTIYTDKWRSFSKLAGDKGYKYKPVNHSEWFVGEDGSHINSVEQFGSSTKRRLKKFNGIHKRQFILHLKESEFRYNFRDDPETLLAELKRIIY